MAGERVKVEEGWGVGSLALLSENVRRIAQQERLLTKEFFVRYTRHNDDNASATFWRSAVGLFAACQFPRPALHKN